MLVKQEKGYYTLTSFAKFPKIAHGFSTKEFGDVRSTIAGNENNILKFAQALGTDTGFVSAEQIHGNKIAKVGKKDRGKVIAGVDGLVTSEQGANLIIRVADCLPLLIFDPEKKAIGLAHAGWLGTVLGVVKNLVERLVDDFESDPTQLVVGFGPSIEFCHYEVSEERVVKIKKAGLEEALMKSVSGKVFFDLKAANFNQLLSTGILKNNIDLSVKSCTYENIDFYSWRREKPDLSGNFAAVIGLKNE